MAKFLNTTGVSHYLEELIKGTEDRLVLISPYLQFSDRIRELIGNLNIRKKDIRIVYRENKLLEENNWLAEQNGIRTSICKNLHAKCYLNEKVAIVTSMNLYEFSQQRNNEMGILISKKDDKQLYDDVFEEVQRLLEISDEMRVTIKKVPASMGSKAQKGYCIRTGVEIDFDVNKPFCWNAFAEWNKDKDWTYPEKFCHFSGEPSNGETNRSKPILTKNYKDAVVLHGKEKCVVHNRISAGNHKSD
jgi:phosphatidylserine/phosphatidylglycerophosphate/cardiolipin synthase-like enzyme